MTEKFGSGRFCSSECSHSKEYSEETRLKTSNSLMNYYANNAKEFNPRLDFGQYVEEAKELYLRKLINPRTLQYYLLDKLENIDFVICPYCQLRLSQINGQHLKKHNKTMNDLKFEFGDNYPIISEVAHLTRSKASSLSQENLVNEGKHSGWQTRNIRSYAELFWEKVFQNNHIKFVSEYVIKKKDLGINERGNYFLDFLIDNFIDVEIDGKQHLYEDRKQHDIKRDERLREKGFLVYRIKWINPIESEAVKKQIDDFLDWYNNIRNIKLQEKICS
jgi:very-short-patch-repair endonuclease